MRAKFLSISIIIYAARRDALRYMDARTASCSAGVIESQTFRAWSAISLARARRRSWFGSNSASSSSSASVI